MVFVDIVITMYTMFTYSTKSCNSQQFVHPQNVGRDNWKLEPKIYKRFSH